VARRSLTDPTDIAYYLACAPADTEGALHQPALGQHLKAWFRHPRHDLHQAVKHLVEPINHGLTIVLVGPYQAEAWEAPLQLRPDI
jgi:hypothetical protein